MALLWTILHWRILPLPQRQLAQTVSWPVGPWPMAHVCGYGDDHGHGITIAPWPQGPTASGPHGLVTPWARGPVALAHGTIVPSSNGLWPMAPSPWTLVSGPWPEWPNRISLFRPPGRIKKIALRRLLIFKSGAPTISLGNILGNILGNFLGN